MLLADTIKKTRWTFCFFFLSLFIYGLVLSLALLPLLSIFFSFDEGFMAKCRSQFCGHHANVWMKMKLQCVLDTKCYCAPKYWLMLFLPCVCGAIKCVEKNMSQFRNGVMVAVVVFSSHYIECGHFFMGIVGWTFQMLEMKLEFAIKKW